MFSDTCSLQKDLWFYIVQEKWHLQSCTSLLSTIWVGLPIQTSIFMWITPIKEMKRISRLDEMDGIYGRSHTLKCIKILYEKIKAFQYAFKIVESYFWATNRRNRSHGFLVIKLNGFLQHWKELRVQTFLKLFSSDFSCHFEQELVVSRREGCRQYCGEEAVFAK